MSNTRREREKKRLIKELTPDDFWDISRFRDFEKWRKHWKPVVTVTLNSETRVNAKKAQRYDDLWTAHVALMNDKCPGCEKTSEQTEQINTLKASVDRLEKQLKSLEPRVKKPTKKEQ